MNVLRSEQDSIGREKKAGHEQEFSELRQYVEGWRVVEMLNAKLA